MLSGAKGGVPTDYKFFVSHRRCHYVQVVTGRFERPAEDFYLPSWERLELRGAKGSAKAPLAVRTVSVT